MPRVPRPGFRNRRRLLVQLAAKDPAGKPRGLNHQAQTLGKSSSHNKTCLYVPPRTATVHSEEVDRLLGQGIYRQL